MAARPDTEAILKASNLRLMPMQTGIQHLLRELYSKPADTELMITDREYHQRYYGTELSKRPRNAATCLALPGKRSRQWRKRPPMPNQSARQSSRP